MDSLDLNALVAAVGDAIVVCDARGAITLWNAAAERLCSRRTVTWPSLPTRSATP